MKAAVVKDKDPMNPIVPLFRTFILISLLFLFAIAVVPISQAQALNQSGDSSGNVATSRRFPAPRSLTSHPANSFTLLYTFTNQADGYFPSPVALDPQGNIYGTAAVGSINGHSGSGTVWKVDTSGSFSVLYTFDMDSAVGTNTSSGLVRDAQGNLYGTTYNGGDLSCFVPFDSVPGCGTVYKMDPSGNVTALYAFTGTSGDGEGAGVSGNIPGGHLVLDAQGNLYGTTVFGGNLANCAGDGCGTVFSVSPAGNETVLYTLPRPEQGQMPQLGLVRDAQGNLYGTLVETGDRFEDGVVFKVDTSGNQSVIYSFNGGNGTGDGSSPAPGLVMDSQGNLYGTTVYGGSGACTCGTVFKLSPTQGGGWTETVLFSFSNQATGETPNGGLAVDSQGSVYGTTISGGTDSTCVLNGEFGCGTIFKVDANGNETVLYSFTAGTGLYTGTNGYLALDSRGTLYGTTTQAGQNFGTVFKFATVGSKSSTVTVTPSASSIAADQPLSVTVVVSGSPTPTGTVTVTSGTYASAPTALTNGSAAINIPAWSLAIGTDTLSGNYSGDTNYSMASGSNSVTATVATPTLTVSPASSSITTAQSLDVTLSVGDGSGSPTATGTVTLTSGNYSSGPTALSFGSATITVPAGSLAVGTDTLTGSYSGDSNYNSATGTNSVAVTQAQTPNFTLSGTSVSLSPGATTGNTSTITVTPSGGFTGNVTLTAAITSSPAGAQDLPRLSFGSTTPVDITSASAGTATLTITTTAPTNKALAYPIPPRAGWYPIGGAALTLALALGIAVPARRRVLRSRLALLVGIVCLLAGLLACGGGSGNGGGGGNPGTTPGIYTVTVTGTSGSITTTATVPLTVQ
ncbi:MAG TPA: choice-of-anchor tandem repeat GloVer-containing protein [Candidatus Solibacter sp.]|nr:choice-of-anchor tandem repeat GloVer-containing protein [Candidatus Solibacter sp.]